MDSSCTNDILKCCEVDFKDFLVTKAPSEAYYIPDFIDQEAEETLLKHVYSVPKPKWTQLSNRRLQNWGGLPHPKGMVPESIPPWLQKYLFGLGSMNLFEGKQPNHVLVNEYLPGQGIMPHLDGPLFFPTITTISLGSHTVLDFYKQLPTDTDDEKPSENTEDSQLSSRYIGSFLLEPRSLVCFKNDMYNVYLHGIDDLEVDDMTAKNFLNDISNQPNIKTRDTRVSLTIRFFPKLLKFKLKLGGR